jgi:integrin alpha FG-GAP repeat containing protein 1
VNNLEVIITGVIPGDFNGDGLMDVVISYEQFGTPDVTFLVCQGNLKELNCGTTAEDVKSYEVIQEPLLIDVNGDMVMDLVGERWEKIKPKPDHHNQNGNQNDSKVKVRSVWVFHPGPFLDFTRFDINIARSEFHWSAVPNYIPFKVKIPTPASNAIVDVDGDTVPELVIVTTYDNKTGHRFFFTEYYRIDQDNGTHWDFVLKKVIALNPDQSDPTNAIGQSLFFDLNQNGQLLHIRPFCRKKDHQNCGFKTIDYTDLLNPVNEIDIQADDDSNDMSKRTFLRFTPQDAESNDFEFDQMYLKAISFRVVDYNMDGFPDLIGTLLSAEDSPLQKKYRAVIFDNVPCVNRTNRNDPHPRSFRLNLQSLSQYQNASMATFYDIYEDGNLDVLVVRKVDIDRPDKHHHHGRYEISGFLINPDYDANFLKVVVTTGKACPKCPLAGIPYGNILLNPVIQYFMSTQEGEDVKNIAAQMYRSSNLPLDLPYVFFGIGHSPNFIDTLDVAVFPSETRATSRKWTQLIPNSQIIILP